MPPCLTLSIIRYGSRVKWSNPGEGVAPSLTPWCSCYRKESLWVTFNDGHQLISNNTLTLKEREDKLIYIYRNIRYIHDIYMRNI